MGISNAIYLTETIIAILSILIGLFVFERKKKEGFLIFLSATVVIFLIMFSLTFILEKPEIDINDVSDIQVKSGEKIHASRTTYHFKDITNNVKVNDDIDYDRVGIYKVEFEVNTLFGKYTKQTTVNVVDTKAPEIILEGGEDYKQSYSKEYVEPGFRAIDEYEGDITNRVKVTRKDIDNNTFMQKYKVFDLYGNESETFRRVTIIDDVPPEITLNGSEYQLVYLNEKYEEKGAKAVDEKDGDLSDKIKIQGIVDTSKEGKYTISYVVSDNSGNQAVKTRKVTVQQKIVIQAQNGTQGNKGVIYLTFDDGPSTKVTPKILDILKEKNVKATFFILNYNAAGEALVKREHAEGHTVAIHGYSHVYKDIYKSEEAYMENITKLQEKIKASTGYNATITRFPGGSSNMVSKFNPGIMSRLCKLITEKGYKYFDWNVSSEDAARAKTADKMYNNVIKGLSHSKQNVVLMHDFGSNTEIIKALPRIIDYGRANGYTFERITESTPMVTHTVNN